MLPLLDLATTLSHTALLLLLPCGSCCFCCSCCSCCSCGSCYSCCKSCRKGANNAAHTHAAPIAHAILCGGHNQMGPILSELGSSMCLRGLRSVILDLVNHLPRVGAGSSATRSATKSLAFSFTSTCTVRLGSVLCYLVCFEQFVTGPEGPGGGL